MHAEPAPVFTALVLAGRRGRVDPLARRAGLDHRALVPVAGVPMLARVLRAVTGAKSVRRVLLSCDDASLLERIGTGAVLPAGRAVEHHPSAHSPSASVLDCLTGPARGERLLVTTADHALLTPDMVDGFCAASRERAADVLVGVVGARTVCARHPDTRRTWIRLGRERYSGANLFLLSTPNAAHAAAFWTRAEAFRKRPLRLVSLFGAATLLRFALGALDLDSAFRRASRAMGVRVEPVVLHDAQYAIDVDHERDLALVEQILAEREARGATGGARPQ